MTQPDKCRGGRIDELKGVVKGQRIGLLAFAVVGKGGGSQKACVPKK